MKKRVIILAMGVLASQLSFSNFVNDGDQKNVEETKVEVLAPVQTQEEAPVSQNTESQEVNDGTVEVATPVIAPVERIQPKTTSLTKTTVKPRKEKAKKLIKGDKVKFKIKGKNNEYEAYFTLKMKGDYINLEKGEFVSKKKK